MGTNYYLKLHLGKTSAIGDGKYQFIWDVSGHNNDSTFKHLMSTREVEITDEYGREWTFEEFMETVERAAQQRHEPRAFS